MAGLAHDVDRLLHVNATNNELCALISFSYNLGIGTMAGSTLLARLNGSWPKELVASQFDLFVHSGGHVLLGLVKRREAEKALFLSP